MSLTKYNKNYPINYPFISTFSGKLDSDTIQM
jgi:hypothetical protein